MTEQEIAILQKDGKVETFTPPATEAPLPAEQADTSGIPFSEWEPLLVKLRQLSPDIDAFLAGNGGSGGAPNFMPLVSQNNEIANSYVYTFAINEDWTRMMCPAGNGASVMLIFENPGGDKAGTFIETAAPSITPIAGKLHICFDSLSGLFLGGEGGDTNVYSYTDNNVATETLLTLSGASITSFQGITSDGTSVFIFDGGTDTVKKFTLAGSTLTYISTVTLDDASAKLYLTADANYLYTFDEANSIYWIFDKATGVTVKSMAALNLLTTQSRGLTVDPDGKLRQLLAYGTIGSINTLWWMIARLSPI